MADYLADFYPEWVDKEENPRQVILDLGKMITNRIPVKLGFQKLNKYDPEYWGLAMLLTDEQAEVALKMGVRKPKTMADMVKLTGKTEEELEKILGDMSFMGILEYNWENPTRTKQWVLPMFVPGSAEFTNMNDTILAKYPEMGRFFERMSRLPLYRYHSCYLSSQSFFQQYRRPMHSKDSLHQSQSPELQGNLRQFP